MPTPNEFDRFAQNYRDIHNENLKDTGYTSSYFAERKIREISAQINSRYPRPSPPAPFRILDLGCGDGLCATFFRKYFPNTSVHGLDVSAESIDAAKARQIPGTEFSVYDGRLAPCDDEAFDIIMLANVLHHVPCDEEQSIILSECHRMLRKNGILFVFEHNPLNPVTRKIVKDCPFDKDAVLITHFRMRRILRAAGFKTKWRFILFLPAFLRKLEFLEKHIPWMPIGGQYYFICERISHYM